jgi:Fic family protein
MTAHQLVRNGFEGKLTGDKCMKITKTSSRTALREIGELIAMGVIEEEEVGGRSTSYRLRIVAERTPKMWTAGDK